jgi:hypothetical protein
MVKRKLLLLLAVGLLALGLVASVAVPWLLAPRAGVTADRFRKLELGLTEEEVEAVLGAPAESSTGFCLDGGQDVTVKYWRGERCWVTVSFSGGVFEGELQTDDGRVWFLSSRRPEPTFWERLSRLLARSR